MSCNVSVSGEDGTLNRKDERLDPQEQGVHEPDGIHPVQNQTLCGAHVRGGGQELMVLL